MTPTLTVIVPSVGRVSAQATLESCVGADQVIVVSTGREQRLWALVLVARTRHAETHWMYVQSPHAGGCKGHLLRNSVLDRRLVYSDYVISVDDDDVLEPGALDKVRTVLARNPGRWLVGRMRFGPGSHCPGVTIWNSKVVKSGNVGTPMIVAPAAARARWGTSSRDIFGRDLGWGYFGDLDYALALQTELGPPVWCETVLACVRPRAIENAA